MTGQELYELLQTLESLAYGEITEDPLIMQAAAAAKELILKGLDDE